mmetsp:Transcript_26843/g.63888  ORF Transcript_26843/g.63888 Transcript_26843/m.63888 type:complete len:106 (-) Transcript_26843:254-571(-)
MRSDCARAVLTCAVLTVAVQSVAQHVAQHVAGHGCSKLRLVPKGTTSREATTQRTRCRVHDRRGQMICTMRRGAARRLVALSDRFSPSQPAGVTLLIRAVASPLL